VVPSFNQGKFIRKTIESILSQTYPNIELLVMDGGSTDGTLEILKSYGERFRWVSESDRGQSHAINKGFAFACGEFVTWLCSDDFYVPSAIEEMMQPFLKSHEIGMVYADCYYVSDDDEPTVLGIKAPALLTKDKFLVRGESLAQPSTLIRKSVLDLVGHLDESLQYAMDYELQIRLFLSTQVSYIPKPLSYYRLHKDSKTVGGAIAQSREVLIVAKRFGVRWFSPLYVRRGKALVKLYLKRVLRLKPKPVKEWSMWQGGVKKFS
jgi:glycosyltransferase involved in cell wall biosynthesis